jgi:hypothetical protein
VVLAAAGQLELGEDPGHVLLDRAVLVSGLTVITAMAGMLLSGDPTFTSFAV